MGEEAGKDSMKPHPEGSEEPMHVQGLLELWSPPSFRLRAQRCFERERLFFGKPLAVHGLYVGSSGKDRSGRGQLRSKASSLLAKPPRNAPGNGSVLPRATGVTESPRGALRIS